MSNNIKRHKFRILTYTIYLFISLYILGLNIYNPKVTLNISYYINNTIYSTLNYFTRIPVYYQTYINSIKYIKELENEKLLLEKQIYSLMSLAIENNILTSENNELRLLFSMLKNIDTYNLKNLITTKIVTKNISNNTSTFVVNAGTQDGVTDNLAVVSYNFLVGRTINTTNKYSKILLLTNSTSRVPVYTKQNNLNAIVVGNNTPSPNLITYDKIQNLQDGDTVLTSGLGGIYPRNIPVGTIHKSKDKWIVKPFINFNNLLYIHIITLNIKS